MIRHHVFFWLKSSGDVVARDRLIAGLRKLADIDLVRELHVGTAAGTGQRDVVDQSFDVSELMYFNSANDQDAYQLHPLHAEFVRECEQLWDKVVVYDTVDV
jgi:hypothetical protein